MDKNEVREMVDSVIAERFGNYGGTAEDLRALGASYLEHHDFRPGDLVMWKPGMRNSKVPMDGCPAVVLEINPEQRSCGGDYNRAYNSELKDVRLGVLIDGDFLGFWVDSHRLQPYWPPSGEMSSA